MKRSILFEEYNEKDKDNSSMCISYGLKVTSEIL